MYAATGLIPTCIVQGVYGTHRHSAGRKTQRNYSKLVNNREAIQDTKIQDNLYNYASYLDQVEVQVHVT